MTPKSKSNISDPAPDPSSAQHAPILVFAQRYQAFFDSTTDAIAVFNREGEILDANPALIKMSGYLASENTVELLANVSFCFVFSN